MLFLRNTIIVLLLLCLAAIAVVGIMVEAPQVMNFTPDRINALGRSVLTVMRPGYLLFFAWWLILLGLILVFLITVARPRRRMKIEVQMGGGRVVIMDAAIKKYIRNALAEIGEITVKKIDLREQRNLVTTDITADVRTRENLPTLERRVISRVRSALAEDLGITNLGDVHVYIRNFEVTGRPITPGPAPAKQPEPSGKGKIDLESESAAPVAGAAGLDPYMPNDGDLKNGPVTEQPNFSEAANPFEAGIAKSASEGDVVYTDSGMMGSEPSTKVHDAELETERKAAEAVSEDRYSALHGSSDLDEPAPWPAIKPDSELNDDAVTDKDKDAPKF